MGAPSPRNIGEEGERSKIGGERWQLSLYAFSFENLKFELCVMFEHPLGNIEAREGRMQRSYYFSGFAPSLLNTPHPFCSSLPIVSFFNGSVCFVLLKQILFFKPFLTLFPSPQNSQPRNHDHISQ